MLPTQNIMDDCDFSNAYDIPTNVNFMMALGKATDWVDLDAEYLFKIYKFHTYPEKWNNNWFPCATLIEW